MSMETVRVTPSIFPPTIKTTPNSPRVWAKLKTAPVMSPAVESGTINLKKVLSFERPKVHDASMSFRSTCSKAVANGWTAKGRLYKIEADRKSTRLNSSHSQISYAVFCLKKKNKI